MKRLFVGLFLENKIHSKASILIPLMAYTEPCSEKKKHYIFVKEVLREKPLKYR